MALSELQKKNLKRVMKLLQMTEANGCSPHEAEVAQNQAKKLMESYNLSEKDVLGQNIEHTDGFYLFNEDGDTYFKIPSWRAILFQYVNEAFGVSAFRTRDSDRDHMVIQSGTETDIEIADYCDGILFDQIIELATEYRTTNKLRKNSKDYNSFLSTITHYVVVNLKEVLSGVQSPGKSKSMYAENKEKSEKALAEYVNITGKSVRTSSAKGRYNSAGEAAASRVSVNGAVSGNMSPQKRIA